MADDTGLTAEERIEARLRECAEGTLGLPSRDPTQSETFFLGVSPEQSASIISIIDAARARIAELEAERGMSEKQARAICEAFGILPDRFYPLTRMIECDGDQGYYHHATNWQAVQRAAEEASDG